MSVSYFVSDLHLTPDHQGKSDVKVLKFIKFLTALNKGEAPFSHPDYLFLVGDIFDLWVADHAYFRDCFREVVEAISALVSAGVQVHYFEGNHDLYLESFWRGKIGCIVHKNGADFTIDGQKIWIEHGDLINPDDKGYLFLRRLLRSQIVSVAAKNLPQSVVAAIGRRASRASRNYTAAKKNIRTDQIRQMIRQNAERRLSLAPYDLIVTGHVHVSDDVQISVGDRTARSINLGAWFANQHAFELIEGKGRFIEVSPNS